MQEVNFLGTACKHPGLPQPRSPDEVITSALTEQELWSICSHGYMPVSVVLAISIYNMGFGNDVKTWFKECRGGELTRVSDLSAGARRNVMGNLHEQARALGAHKILSLQTVVENLQDLGCMEFFAFGTAVSRTSVRPQSA